MKLIPLSSISVNEKNNTIRFGLRRKRFNSLGSNLRFGGMSVFNRTENISIGSDVFFGADGYYEAVSALTIGNGCMFGPRVFCIAGSHNYDCADLRSVPYDNRMVDLPIVIEDNVWVAGNVSIAPGTHIGEGSVIGMGTVVSGDVPKCSVVIGGKGTVVKQRDPETYRRLVSEGMIYSRVYAGRGFEVVSKGDLPK